MILLYNRKYVTIKGNIVTRYTGAKNEAIKYLSLDFVIQVNGGNTPFETILRLEDDKLTEESLQRWYGMYDVLSPMKYTLSDTLTDPKEIINSWINDLTPTPAIED